MSFKSIIGQPLAVELIQRWLGQKTTQPLLFYGPAGAGKRAAALEAAMALNCLGGPRLDGCGSCLSCKKIAGGRHPDVRMIDLAYQAAIRGEPVEKQQSLRIETILEERKRLYQTAGEAAWKVSIVDGAHRFTPDAANVLLKVMEEPPPATAIFLLTEFRDRIFATIISRCQPVRFRALSDSDRPAALSHEDVQAASQADALWEKLPQLRPGEILALQPRGGRAGAANRADIESDIVRLLAPALRELRAARPGAARRVELIQRAQQQLRQNVPPSLVFDTLLLQLAGVPAR
jgi:DNA polymerase-3 subunit delta'